MSLPIIENIAVDIEAAINAITVANGFNQNLVAVRPKRVEFNASNLPWGDLDVLIKQAGQEEVEPGIGTKHWRQIFLIAAIVIDSERVTDSIDTRLNQVSADIEKKLTADPQRGNNAIDTQIEGAEPFDDDAGISGILIQVSVEYWTVFNDPYTKG